MKPITEFADRFRACLETIDVASPDVRVYPADSAGYQYYGEVVSPDFETMNDGKRQRLVWDRILALLDYRDQERVAFVYTNAPAELLDQSPIATPEASPAPASS
jgi:hypothetical protein